MARDARAMMERIVTEAGLRVGTGGIANREVEIFPKQDAIDEAGYGSLNALPFARRSAPLDADMRPTAEPWRWEASAVPPVAAADLRLQFEKRPQPVPIEDVISALGVIDGGEITPNGSPSATPYTPPPAAPRRDLRRGTGGPGAGRTNTERANRQRNGEPSAQPARAGGR
jgi:hypothetical protein